MQGGNEAPAQPAPATLAQVLTSQRPQKRRCRSGIRGHGESQPARQAGAGGSDGGASGTVEIGRRA